MSVPDSQLFITEDLNEVWADTKSPGDSFTYSVGSVEIRDTTIYPQTGNEPEFSDFPVGVPPDIDQPIPLPPLSARFRLEIAGSPGMLFLPKRQVVILQCVDQFGSIQWQKYLYGNSPDVGVARYRCATNARAISVWPGPTDAETRIAICGEQNDDILPFSQAPDGWVVNPSTMLPPRPFSGFIAVYNGLGTLLWTHHFFGSAPATMQYRDCAITDVSIRVVGTGETARDVVTYCGISNLGNPAAGNEWLTPIKPFDPLNGSGGASDFGIGQFDGLVGRLSRSHPNFATDTTSREFHSVVGGPGNDGLFGIAELENDQFVVVGSTDGLESGGVFFPFFAAPVAGSYRVGTALVFDASPNPAAKLVLKDSIPLGTRGQFPTLEAPIHSIARDVAVHLDDLGTPGNGSVQGVDIVGATNDPDFFNSFGVIHSFPSPSLAFDRGGVPVGSAPPSEGFFLGLWNAGGTLTFNSSRSHGFLGGPGEDGLTGVSAWNEYTDQPKVCGYTRDAGGNVDLLVASLLVGIGTTISPTSNLPEWAIVNRRAQWGGAAEDRPAVMGPQSVQFDTGLGPSTSYGSHAGGGISVDPRSRMTVVGATKSLDYPVTAPLFEPRYGPARTTNIPVGNPNDVSDAVRTEFDMLPERVGRRDGTGSSFGSTGLGPVPLPPVGATGGTTPAAALAPFGRRVGEPAPLLKPMAVDYEGDNVAGATPAIVFTPPSNEAIVGGTGLQFGFPVTTPVLIDAVEFWLFDPSVAMQLDPWAAGMGSWRFHIPYALPSMGVISAQLLSLVTCSPSTWTVSPCPHPDLPNSLAIVGSTALFFEF
mgnify:CR=1 FL=1